MIPLWPFLRRKRALLLLRLNLGLFVLFPWTALPAAPGPAPPAAPAESTSPYGTEQEWIISSICRNTFELLDFDENQKGETERPQDVTLKKLSDAPLSYEVTVHGAHTTAEATLQWTGSIWSAAAYLPLCQSAARALKLPTAPAAHAQGDPLHVLLDYSEASLEAESGRISQWLTHQPGDAAAHEQAALVLGTLALKDNSGPFWDPRDACNQACAHLAVAQFLRGGKTTASVEGRLAACLVGLIADTKTETGHELDDLDSAQKASADLESWLNAARMRNSRDWRIVKSPERATPLEQVEYFRALGEAVDPDQAINWLRTSSLPNRPDWGRIVLEEGFSVDAGHLFAEPSIAMELRVMQTTFPGSFRGAQLVSDLNEAPGDSVGEDGKGAGAIRVINRGMWAQFFQRHLCQAISATGDFFANKWGVPDNTLALDQAVEKAFPGLTLYPFLQFINSQLRSYPWDPTTLSALFAVHPEWAPYRLTKINADQLKLQQDVRHWFTPAMLEGTAYQAFDRLRGSGATRAEIDRLYALAPLQYGVARLELESRSQGSFTFDQAQQVLGPMLDYYTPAIDLARRASGLTLDEQVDLAKKSAEINPDNYFDLAHLYIANHQDDLAAGAYQQWVDKAPDRVEVSNSIEWLVDYYYAHGQADRAMALAKEAAEVYSGGGLLTMLHLLERMGRLDEAEEYGKRILERYQDASALIAFYNRHLAETGFKTKLDQLVGSAFPGGLKNVTLSSFSAPPTLGMSFAGTTDEMKRVGLSADQVVVALDGYAVQNQAQYTFVRGLSESSTMRFILWNGTSYQELTVDQPSRHFGVNLQDYHH